MITKKVLLDHLPRCVTTPLLQRQNLIGYESGMRADQVKNGTRTLFQWGNYKWQLGRGREM